jgi:hypothetical protein
VIAVGLTAVFVAFAWAMECKVRDLQHTCHDLNHRIGSLQREVDNLKRSRT